MGFFVPEALKNCAQWVVQRNKIPYDPKTGRKASSMNRAHWGSFEEAQTRCEYGDFDGLGFVFSADDDFVFIDLDDCMTEDGELNSFAEEVLKLFPSTYIEISMSEKGLHIVCRGKIYRAIKRNDIEVYSSGRYMAFTGNAISPTEPQNAQKAIDVLCKQITLTEPSKAVKTHSGYTADAVIKTTSAGRTMEDVLAIIQDSRQGEKFNLLYEGKWQGMYESQSQADQAFINIVNHFSDGNDEITKAIFASSKLSERDKGKRDDYVSMTIQKAKMTATGSRTKGITRSKKLTDTPEKKRHKNPLFV